MSTPGQTPIVEPIRPTVRVDGQASDAVTSLLLAMRVDETEGGMSALELRLLNMGRQDDGSAMLMFEDEAVIKFGAEIAVYGGTESAPQEIFRGKITAIEGLFDWGNPPELVVLAEDTLMQARLARRTKVHEDATIASLVQDLASRLGLTPVVTGLSESIGLQVQIDETDLAFLRRLLAQHDADMQVVAHELHVSARRDVQRGTISLTLGEQLRRARLIADLAHQVTEVTVGGWDARQGQQVSGTGTGTNWGPGSGRKGGDTLRQAFGERSEHLRDMPVTTNDEARAIAETMYDRRARRFVRVDATAVGNPALRVGTYVTLTGTGPRFDNTYYLTRACHRFDIENGYQTDFEAECAFLGGP